jgi:hypothetical protein
MQTEPRLPDLKINTAPRPAPRGRVEDVLDRLSLTGYRVDRDKWAQFERAGLIDMPMPTEAGEREAIRRLRRILDVERRLAPSGDIDALCFHLTAAGIDRIPAQPVARHIIASLTDLFTFGDRLRGASPSVASMGPDGEFRLARRMAQAVLREYRTTDLTERRALESLLGAALVAYVRSTFANPRPARLLHASSRLVTLDADDAQPVKNTASAPLPPLADRTGLIEWLTSAASENETAVLRATQSVAALVRLHVHHFPELQLPWRDVAASSPTATTPLRALALVPPVLAAAYLQAGRAPSDPSLDRMLEQLMHHWGTVSFEAVRFELSTGTFPWVKRSVE